MVVSRVMLLLFLTAQGFDGLFTYTAVHAYGLHAEGNVLIATWMALVGPGGGTLRRQDRGGRLRRAALRARAAPHALPPHHGLRRRRHRALADGVRRALATRGASPLGLPNTRSRAPLATARSDRVARSH